MVEMTPTQIKSQAPQGATHYDIEGGKAVYYKVNNLGYTMRYDGVTWYALYGASYSLNYSPCSKQLYRLRCHSVSRLVGLGL